MRSITQRNSAAKVPAVLVWRQANDAALRAPGHDKIEDQIARVVLSLNPSAW
jgi:hypothetical protein